MTRIIVRVQCLLGSSPIYDLPEISLLIEQPHADYRHTQITCGLELIAGHIAESA